MKKLFSILCAIVILCISVIPSYGANPKISVSTVSSASVGDTITVSVNLSANSGLAGVNFTVSFNTSDFQLVSDSVSTNALFVGDKSIGNGSIKYAGISADAINSSGTLLSFKLKVLKTGGKISLSIKDAIDENDRFVNVSTSGATVSCSHANMNWTVTKNATCTASGEKKGSCACGYTKTESVAKKQHSYGGWVVESNPTETKTGLKTSTCSACGDKREQIIPAIVTTTTKPSVVTTTKPSSNNVTTTKPATVTTTKPTANTTATTTTVTTTAPSVTTTTTVTTTAPSVTTTTKVENSTTETTTEPVTEATTSVTETTTLVDNTTEITTEEQTTIKAPQVVEKSSTPKIIATTIIVILGIEAIGLLIFFAIKKKKQK